MHGAAAHGRQTRQRIDEKAARGHVEGTEPAQENRGQEPEQRAQIGHLNGLNDGFQVVNVHDVFEVRRIVPVGDGCSHTAEHAEQAIQGDFQVFDRIGEENQDGEPDAVTDQRAGKLEPAPFPLRRSRRHRRPWRHGPVHQITAFRAKCENTSPSRINSRMAIMTEVTPW